MSKSKRKSPCMGFASSKAQHLFKAKESRAKRRMVRTLLSMGEELMPHDKEYGNEWASPRDGKQWMQNPDPKWMRK